jgi:hypothetical protein
VVNKRAESRVLYGRPPHLVQVTEDCPRMLAFIVPKKL